MLKNLKFKFCSVIFGFGAASIIIPTVISACANTDFKDVSPVISGQDARIMAYFKDYNSDLNQVLDANANENKSKQILLDIFKKRTNDMFAYETKINAIITTDNKNKNDDALIKAYSTLYNDFKYQQILPSPNDVNLPEAVIKNKTKDQINQISKEHLGFLIEQYKLMNDSVILVNIVKQLDKGPNGIADIDADTRSHITSLVDNIFLISTNDYHLPVNQIFDAAGSFSLENNKLAQQLNNIYAHQILLNLPFTFDLNKV
ncbi:hypothetical protein [[Mycoplasma] testudinis]|uniref:hypothetical protein n=1 Tax=[Mycoplasma] testudinis TaxID=33924 RepID=UPI000A8E4911|nr:hypothetical protein [[Mycoplasma] testudinis]